ncbi:kinesin light chain [Colletotrichum musicola]|uniref:Kinesin light chain n=1 Tax=Colletotrichum musicola TaxID=2175873 RepID=A0A8H6NE18_9PEZI|nr:kinesin light chain [Colletotrichum musicola]
MTTAGAASGKTFRIRGVPTAWDEARLQSFLSNHDGCVDPVAKSLAIEAHKRSKTGTATFTEFRSPSKTLRTDGLNAVTLSLDDDFLGLTTLYAPSADDHHKVDILVLASSRPAMRPLIMVAHSLGGLIVTQAVIDMANSGEENERRIIQALHGIVFFGVPHDGMEISQLIPMVGNSANRELIGSMSRINSQILTMQQREFHRALGPKAEKRIEIFCFCETQESPTAQQQLFFALTREDTVAAPGNKPKLSSRLSDYIPECSQGSILITTRDKKCGTKFARAQSLADSLVEVPKMSEKEARQLLHRILGDRFPSKDTSALSIQLEHLPLALVQAAAFIQENCISAREYLNLLKESDDAFAEALSDPFEAVGRDSTTPHAVTSTWIISFKQVQKRDPLASDILSVISLLDRQAIPEVFIMRYCDERGGKATTNDILKALGTLKAFSFVTKAKDKTIDMHRLVHLVTRKWLASQNKSAEFTEHALKTMANIFSYGNHDTHAICRDYLPHAQALLSNVSASVQSCNIERATILYRMAGYHDYTGHWREAEERFQQAIELQTRLLGEEHDDALNSKTNLGLMHLCCDSGWLWWKEVDHRVNGEDQNTMECMTDLGALFVEQRRLKEAEELLSRVLAWHQRQRTADDTLKLRTTSTLGEVFLLQGRYDEAKKLQVWEVETRVRMLGEEHPDTLVSMGNLASTSMRPRQWEEAEKIQSQVTDISKRVLGEEHPDTLTAIAKLALIYSNLGRFKEAEGMLTQVTRTMKE